MQEKQNQGPLDDLLQTKMNRKEFLAHTGAMVMAVTGVSSVIKALNMPHRRTSGYGSGSYGGRSKNS